MPKKMLCSRMRKKKKVPKKGNSRNHSLKGEAAVEIKILKMED